MLLLGTQGFIGGLDFETPKTATFTDGGFSSEVEWDL